MKQVELMRILRTGSERYFPAFLTLPGSQPGRAFWQSQHLFLNYKLSVMKLWSTKFKARDARTGEMKTWCGENVEAPTHELAQQWCYENRGYLIVIGELVAEIPCKEGTYEPDFSKMVDYENIGQN